MKNINPPSPGPSSPLFRLAAKLEKFNPLPTDPQALASMLLSRFTAEMDFQLSPLWGDRVEIVRSTREVLKSIKKKIARLEGCGTDDRKGTLCLRYPFEPIADDLVDPKKVTDPEARKDLGRELVTLIRKLEDFPLDETPLRQSKAISAAASEVAILVRAYLQQHEATDYVVPSAKHQGKTRINSDAVDLLGRVLRVLDVSVRNPERLAKETFNSGG